jgi:hypothetical protein
MRRAIDEGRTIMLDTAAGECIDRESGERLDWWPFPPARAGKQALTASVA